MRLPLLIPVVILLPALASKSGENQNSESGRNPPSAPRNFDSLLRQCLPQGARIIYSAKEKSGGSVPDGRFSAVDKDGRQLLAGTYKKGVLDGELITFHPSGRLSSRELYDNGKLISTAVDWDSNGRIVRTANYDRGEKEGLETYWLGSGDVRLQILWKATSPEWIAFYESGVVVKKLSGDGALQYFRQKALDDVKPATKGK